MAIAKHWQSRYTLFDLTGYVNLGKYHPACRCVQYRQQKYYTWEISLRGIREFGTVNRVDNKTHAGIERFLHQKKLQLYTLKLSSKVIRTERKVGTATHYQRR